jgi:hypothetical protein
MMAPQNEDQVSTGFGRVRNTHVPDGLGIGRVNIKPE